MVEPPALSRCPGAPSGQGEGRGWRAIAAHSLAMLHDSASRIRLACDRAWRLPGALARRVHLDAASVGPARPPDASARHGAHERRGEGGAHTERDDAVRRQVDGGGSLFKRVLAQRVRRTPVRQRARMHGPAKAWGGSPRVFYYVRPLHDVGLARPARCPPRHVSPGPFSVRDQALERQATPSAPSGHPSPVERDEGHGHAGAHHPWRPRTPPLPRTPVHPGGELVTARRR